MKSFQGSLHQGVCVRGRGEGEFMFASRNRESIQSPGQRNPQQEAEPAELTQSLPSSAVN